MGSDDDMFRIWSGPEGSSHKEPLSGIRIHRAHGRFLVPGHVVKKSPVKARLSNLIYPLRNAACWRCLGIDGYVVQEAAVLLLEFLQLKRPVSLGGETGLFLSLGLWIGGDNNRWRLFRVLDAACGRGGYSESCGGDCCECDCARRCIARVRELAGGRICLLAAARVRLLGGAW